MFGLFKNAKTKKAKKNRTSGGKLEGAADPNKPLDREALKAQAMANAKAARESIGEETLEKIAEALQKKQNSAAERAKQEIAGKDPRDVAAEVLAMRRGKYE